MDTPILLDETFDKHSSSEMYNLYVSLGSSFFSYTIHDLLRNKFIGYRSIAIPDAEKSNAQIEEILSHDEHLQLKYKNTRFLYPSFNTLLLPEALFEESKVRIMFSYVHPLTEKDVLKVNKIAGIHSHLIFSIPQSVTSLIDKHFQDASYYQHCTPLLLQALDSAKTGVCVVACINADTLHLLIITGHQIQLFNTYSIRTDEDILFHLYNGMQNCSVDPSAPVTVTGMIRKNDNRYSFLNNYFKNLSIARLSNDYLLSYKLTETDHSCDYNLFNLARCD